MHFEVEVELLLRREAFTRGRTRIVLCTLQSAVLST
jgi:hypothetical protein